MAGDSEKSGDCSHSVIENHHAEIGIGTWRKRVVLAIAFAVLFHLVDSATAFAQKICCRACVLFARGTRINKRFKAAGVRPWPRVRMTLSIESKSQGRQNGCAGVPRSNAMRTEGLLPRLALFRT